MYDVIIIGGGPSGASAGRTAGKLGLNTLLLEKEEFPRYKPCGGGLSEHAISSLDFELPRDIIEWEVTGVRITYRGQSVEVQEKHRMSVLVSRDLFDNFLLEKAKETGIEVHTGEKALCCREMPDYVEVETEKQVYRAKFAVIAEGVQGVVKTCVRPTDTREQCAICVVTEIPAVEKEIEERLGKKVELHFGIASGGYGWIFPHKTYYSVGVGGIAKDFSHPKETMINFLKKNGFYGEYKLHAHKVPLGGFKRKIKGPRVLLVGDAAGFVDAFLGEGLPYAIISGKLAAEVIADICLQGRSMKELCRYESHCRAEFETHLRYSLLFSKMMHRLPDRAFKVFTSNEKLISKYLEVVDCRINYKDYLQWCLFNSKLV